MAVTASGLFPLTYVSALKNLIAFDLDLETHKIALFSNTITPNFLTDTAYAVAPYNANEVSGTNWAAGGVAVTGTSCAATSAGTASLVFDATDVSVASTTLTAARCGLIYADALAGNEAICLINFGADYSTSNGTFAITWDALGIFAVDMAP